MIFSPPGPTAHTAGRAKGKSPMAISPLPPGPGPASAPPASTPPLPLVNHTGVPAGQGAPALSRREAEVLSLIGQGKTHRQVAQDLFLSVRTVGFHLDNVFRKLRVNHRVHALRRASQLCLLPDGPSPG